MRSQFYAIEVYGATRGGPKPPAVGNRVGDIMAWEAAQRLSLLSPP